MRNHLEEIKLQPHNASQINQEGCEGFIFEDLSVDFRQDQVETLVTCKACPSDSLQCSVGHLDSYHQLLEDTFAALCEPLNYETSHKRRPKLGDNVFTDVCRTGL